MKILTRCPYTIDSWPVSRALAVLCTALLTVSSAAAHARSTASITPIAKDASRVSSPSQTVAATKLSALAGLATGEVVNFTLSEPPKPVPDNEIKDMHGQTVTLPQFQGKVLVVNFWATWCAPCKRELPSLDRLQERVGTDDLAVLAISIDRRGVDKVQPYLDQVPLPHLSVLLDKKNKLGRGMGTFGLPTTVLVDQRGHEVGRLIGPAEWDSDESIALVRYVIENGPGGLAAAAPASPVAQRVGTGTSPE